MESVIFPAARFRMMRSHYYSSSLLHRKYIISHIDHLVPAAICVEMGLALFSRNRSHVSPALALPINMPNRHTGTLPNPVCSAAGSMSRWRTQEMTPSSMTTTKTAAITADWNSPMRK